MSATQLPEFQLYHDENETHADWPLLTDHLYLGDGLDDDDPTVVRRWLEQSDRTARLAAFMGEHQVWVLDTQEQINLELGVPAYQLDARALRRVLEGLLDLESQLA